MTATDARLPRTGARDRAAIERRMLFPQEPCEMGEPRWRIDARWIEFECGCRAERTDRLHTQPMPYDPIIFGGLPEMAVYDFVCHHHSPAMNKRLHFGHYLTFDQWRRHRRHVLMGKGVA